MIIETKFDLGQTVWRIGRYQHESFVLPCRFCRGKGRLPLEGATNSTRYVTCPECHGSAKRAIESMPAWTVLGSTIIGKVSIEVVDPTVEGFNGGSPERVREERYMGSTGFPSGSIYRAVEMFATEDEAREAVEERNARLQSGADGWKPDRDAYTAAKGFLDHRDVYEHDAAAIEAAKKIIDAYEYEPEEVEGR